MLTGYKEEFKSGFEVTNVLSAMPWSDQLTKRPEEELGWEQLVLRDTNGDLGYQVYFNHRKLRQWGVDVDQLTCNLPQIGDVRDFCENAVKRGFLKAREDVEQLVVVSSIARELMINKEIYEGKKSEIRIRNLVPRILGGMFVGALTEFKLGTRILRVLDDICGNKEEFDDFPIIFLSPKLLEELF